MEMHSDLMVVCLMEVIIVCLKDQYWVSHFEIMIEF